MFIALWHFAHLDLNFLGTHFNFMAVIVIWDTIDAGKAIRAVLNEGSSEGKECFLGKAVVLFHV
jgi:hypothetical protein